MKYTDILLQSSLQAIAVGKINETRALLVSSLRQINWDRVSELGFSWRPSPTHIDVASGPYSQPNTT